MSRLAYLQQKLQSNGVMAKCVTHNQKLVFAIEELKNKPHLSENDKTRVTLLVDMTIMLLQQASNTLMDTAKVVREVMKSGNDNADVSLSNAALHSRVGVLTLSLRENTNALSEIVEKKR